MDQSKLDYLKREIKRNYKRFTGERTDGKATLMDVLKLFNISVDESRTEDYLIESIDYSVPSIKVIDKKTNTEYTSKYTDNADLLDYSGAIEFNSVISTSLARIAESLYFIGSKMPIIKKMTFTENDEELVFLKEWPNNIKIFSPKWIRFQTIYQKNIKIEGQNYKQKLLTRIFDDNFTYSSDAENFERCYTYDLNYNRFIEKNDTQDKFSFVRGNGIVYGITDYEQKNICNYLHGVCLESTKVNLEQSLPYNITPEEYPLLERESGTIGAIVFKGSTNQGHHKLEIYKREWRKSFTIDYYLEKYTYENGKRYDETLISEHFDLPILEEGNITNEEVGNIRVELEKRFPNDNFIQIILNELAIFKQKIEIRKGLVEEELDPLSPKLLTNKPFEEICDLVSANKEEYFKLVREQFESATNIAQEKENGQSRILKPSTPQE